MKKTLLLAASFLALTSVSAFAEGPYVAADLGLSITHESDIKPDGADSIKADFKSGFGFDIAGGYAFNQNIRAEGEFGYKSNDVDKYKQGGQSASPAGTNTTTIMSFMANGIYDITQFELPVTPYVGLGLGALSGKFKRAIDTITDTKTATALGYQLMLGVSYPINKNCAINAGYKLQGAAGDFSVKEDDGSKTKVSYLNSTVLIGARYNF